MPNIGPMELIVVLVIALVVLGPKRLPGLGKQLGTGMRDFKEAISGSSHDEEDRNRHIVAPASAKEETVVTPVGTAEKPSPQTRA